MKIVHQHLLYQSVVKKEKLFKTAGLEKVFEKFLLDLLVEIDMTCLIPPQVKISHLDAWTGMVGIITSHIAFHFWVKEKYVQIDIYSCKPFDNYKAITFINKFWNSCEVKALSINRKMDENFKIERINSSK